MKYMISDLARLLNVSTNTVRRYESKGYIKSIREDEQGYRCYDEDAIINFMNARLMRKYGFTHEELDDTKNYNLEQLVETYTKRLADMDRQIDYLCHLRHRLKDDLVLMKKVDVFQEPGYVRDCMPLTYVLYQSGSKLLKESGRLEKVQDYLYLSPEVQRIYIIRKEDVEQNKIILHVGWAMKISDLEKFNVSENEYTERYNKRKSIMGLAKLPVNSAEIRKMTDDELKELLLKDQLAYMKENNLRLCGDIIGIVIAKAVENGQDVQYILMNLPIENE